MGRFDPLRPGQLATTFLCRAASTGSGLFVSHVAGLNSWARATCSKTRVGYLDPQTTHKNGRSPTICLGVKPIFKGILGVQVDEGLGQSQPLKWWRISVLFLEAWFWVHQICVPIGFDCDGVEFPGSFGGHMVVVLERHACPKHPKQLISWEPRKGVSQKLVPFFSVVHLQHSTCSFGVIVLDWF